MLVGKSPSKLCTSAFVTLIVTAIVTAAVSIVTPASAEILTVCANESQASATTERFAAGPILRTLIPLSAHPRIEEDALVALWHDEEGFDILINWGRSGQQSLRAEGAQVSGAAPRSAFVHLMVAYADGALEHFLFDLDESGAGELLRTAAPDAPAAAPSESIATCLKPR